MRMPVIYLPHGGGPWPFVDVFGGDEVWGQLRSYLEQLPASLPDKPKAILSISAHWEERVPTVQTEADPSLYYDYYGFPESSYHLKWAAQGAPELARRVRSLVEAAGLPAAEEQGRGYDHGTFVPLMVAWPEGEVPVIQLSLVRGLDPATHLKLGAALQPLRDEGVLIVGSGMSFHNMRLFRHPEGARAAHAFNGWLVETLANAEGRGEALERWAAAPGGRVSHPREEHLLPLHVVVGAAGSDPADIRFDAPVLGTRVIGAHFG